MVWKVGDTAALEIYFESNAGVFVSYANLAAFTAAGGSFSAWNGIIIMSSQPTFSLTPISNGDHLLSLAIPSGCTNIIITPPTGYRSDPHTWTLIGTVNDNDSLAANIATSIGNPTPGAAFTSGNDFTTIEGDTFAQALTVALSSLIVFDATLGTYSFADLSDISAVAWTIVASARGPWNQLPGNAVDFSYTCAIPDKPNRKIVIGCAAPIAAALVKNADGTTDTAGAVNSTAYKYDVQMVPPVGSTYAARKLTVLTGTHTVMRQQTTSP